MASSDEEGEIVPNTVTDYQFVDSQEAPVPFSILPLHWNDTENDHGNSRFTSTRVFLIGTTDGGLQKTYKEVVAWKLELSYVVPEIYVLSKGKMWIKLEKPNKKFEDIVKNVLITVCSLHFLKRNPEADRNMLWGHLIKTSSSYNLVEPCEYYLLDHVIRSAAIKDKDLAKSKYLEAYLIEIEDPERRENFHKENQTTNKSKFIVSDDDEYEDDADFNDETAGLFDSVCAFCDNGGDVLPCEGRCLRSFHPTIDAGADTCCESLGFADAAQYEALAAFYCNNCKHQQHQCFVCSKLGSSDKSSSIEVFPCFSATCGHFYHPKCVAPLLSSDKTMVQQLERQIAAGESFTCPIHKCNRCKQGENKEVHELQFAVCRRCPKAYHRKCLPREIAFEGSDGSVLQRAWDNLLPKRILLYCMKHEIIPSLGTPKRDHISFPYLERKKMQEGNAVEKVMSEKRSKSFGNLMESNSKTIREVVERRPSTVTYGDPAVRKGKSSTAYENKSSVKDIMSISRKSSQPSTMVQSNLGYKDKKRDQMCISRPAKSTTMSTTPSEDPNLERRISKLMKDSTSSFNVDEFIKEEKRRCTRKIYSQQTGLDKTITEGKVEASVKAVRTALEKLEKGCSIEDAKAVCEPEVLNQLIRWKNKLAIYLAPVLHGLRYTSFGRHFTKVDKLEEIVNRLHWYVEPGDTIVDFCCGSNDFSWLMKEKLDSMGKKCSFKNYDLIMPKNQFNFEKKDWFSIPVGALPDGSHLVMGLNPPFGFQASLANSFIDHALEFKPKLLILIVPKETKRLDQKRTPYDLIWEEDQMLSGKSFYLPGSVNIQDQPLEDWNWIPPPLSLWSRPDMTAKHKAVAERHDHIRCKQTKVHEEVGNAFNYLMEEKHDCYGDFSNIVDGYHDISAILDDVPEELDDCQRGGTTTNSSDGDKCNLSTTDHGGMNLTSEIGMDIKEMVDGTTETDLSSPVTSSTNSGPAPRREAPRCVQPSYPRHHAAPGYATFPYGSSIGYPQPPLNAFASVGHALPPRPMTSMQPPHPSYGHNTYPSQTLTGPNLNYARYETDIWPPRTMPSHYRLG